MHTLTSGHEQTIALLRGGPYAFRLLVLCQYILLRLVLLVGAPRAVYMLRSPLSAQLARIALLLALFALPATR